MDAKAFFQDLISRDGFAKRADEFYKHLDMCERCRNEPFNLCPEGSKKLAATVAP